MKYDYGKKYDYSKLLGKIKEIFGTQDNFAKALGISGSALSFRITGKMEFSQKEIDRAITLLKLKPRDIPLFFSQKV